MKKRAPRAVQGSLFEEIPAEALDLSSSIVRIEAEDADELSPHQKRFNTLVRKIERLRRDIDERTRVYNEILRHWAVHLAPIQTELAELQIRFAFALEAKAAGFKLGIRQRESVGGVIVGLLDDAFSQIPPAKEAQDLFSRWSVVSFDEELEQQKSELAEVLGDAIRGDLGIDIDEETLRKGPEAIQAAIEEALRGGGPDRNERRRKSTKKQREKDERARLAEEGSKKILHSLYLSLVKMLHPDTELDESSKEKKEGLMKEVTAAYGAGDLHTLLRIEMEWLDRESPGLARLAEDKLAAYLSALKDQVRELENELAFLSSSERFMSARAYLDVNFARGRIRIDAAVLERKNTVKLVKRLLREFAGEMEKQRFVERIREL